MTEFKFSCARCGQHILAGANYQGLQIQCPACRASITVPSLAPRPIGAPAPEPIAVPTPVRQLPTTPQSRAFGLAKASLILSIASLVIGPFGFIPGILCGHLAKGRMRKDPLLQGRKLATAGLLVGYGFVALTIVITGILFSVGFDAVRRLRRETEASVSPASHSSARALPGAPPPPAASVDTGSGAEGDAWKLDLSAVAIPKDPISGRMHGRRFVCDLAEVSPSATPRLLTLQQGAGAQGDLKITLIIPDRNGLEGRTINLPTTAAIPAEGDYRVSILYQENGEYHSQQFTRNQAGFVLRLECEQRSRKRIKGRIYLCLGDDQKSYVAGSFEAKLR